MLVVRLIDTELFDEFFVHIFHRGTCTLTQSSLLNPQLKMEILLKIRILRKFATQIAPPQKFCQNSIRMVLCNYMRVSCSDNLNAFCLYKSQNRERGRWPSVFCLHVVRRAKHWKAANLSQSPTLLPLQLHLSRDFERVSRNRTQYWHTPLPFSPPSLLLTLNWLQTNFRQWHLTHPLKYLSDHIGIFTIFIKIVFC